MPAVIIVVYLCTLGVRGKNVCLRKEKLMSSIHRLSANPPVSKLAGAVTAHSRLVVDPVESLLHTQAVGSSCFQGGARHPIHIQRSSEKQHCRYCCSDHGSKTKRGVGRRTKRGSGLRHFKVGILKTTQQEKQASDPSVSVWDCGRAVPG